MKPSRRDTAAAFVVVAVAAAVALSFASAPATGGDAPGILQTEPSQEHVQPGESFTVDLVLTSDGGYGDVDVSTVNVVLTYSEGVTATSVEYGPWFEDHGDPEQEHEIDPGSREVSIRQSLDEGATGGAVNYATVAFDTDSDFEGNVSIQPDRVEITLTNDLPSPAVPHHSTVYVGDTPPGETENDGDDSVPQTGFTAVAGVLTLAVASVYRSLSRVRRS